MMNYLSMGKILAVNPLMNLEESNPVAGTIKGVNLHGPPLAGLY